MSHEEIKNEVIGSLVWWNEWTGEIYYGFDGLKFGCNVEDWYYAGLCLEQNPYNVQMDFSFYGGPNSNINVNSFVAWWVTPISKDGFQVDLGTFTVEVPPPITLDEFDAYYYE